MFKITFFVLFTLLITLSCNAQDLDKLPDFNVSYLKSGKPFSSKSLSGKVTLINFWSVWCAPCIEELPFLQKVYNRFKDNPSVRILAIHCTINKSRHEVLKFVEKHHLELPFFYDDDLSARRSFNSGGIPRNYLIDQNGNIVKEINDRPHKTFVKRVSQEIENQLSQQ